MLNDHWRDFPKSSLTPVFNKTAGFWNHNTNCYYNNLAKTALAIKTFPQTYMLPDTDLVIQTYVLAEVPGIGLSDPCGLLTTQEILWFYNYKLFRLSEPHQLCLLLRSHSCTEMCMYIDTLWMQSHRLQSLRFITSSGLSAILHTPSDLKLVHGHFFRKAPCHFCGISGYCPINL